MSYVDVPGARLYVEIEGTGPLLVMVPGAAGVADVFRPVAWSLTRHFTVLRYDRRGFGRSQPIEPTHDRLRVDADDVRHLVEHTGGSRPAAVFGSSSGAIVALVALIDHPHAVGAVLAHEPPLMRLVPDGQKWIDFFHGTYELYRQAGAERAIATFRQHTFPASDVDAMAHAPRTPANAGFWLEQELRQYPAVDLDLDVLRSRAGRIVPAVGQASTGYPCQQASVALAVAVGRPVADLPGGHIGFLTDTAAFAVRLYGLLNGGPHEGDTR
jgi:pimeloyl-ACP methyl ester carboxylesterase